MKKQIKSKHFTPLGPIHRKKYEQEKRFLRRIDTEFRVMVKSLYTHQFDAIHNMAIINYGLLDLSGNPIIDYRYNSSNKKSPKQLLMKYVTLKIKLVAE